jgi:hypothetical protein
VGHSLFATPAEVRRSAYAQLTGHAVDGKRTVDRERTRLADISGTWEHLKTGAARARGHTLTDPATTEYSL